MRWSPRRGWEQAAYAAGGYTLAALILTWPLARGLTRDVAWDLGDSVLNMWILSTFVLSGLGMFLFARELTGSIAAAFIGGLLFAFAPYRIPQSSHLQVLSSQWMPFALYGFRRYFDGGRIRALAGATAAAIVQGLSCGYYLLYFSPFAALYVLYEMWRVGRLTDRRTWLALSIAAIAAAIVI